MNGAVRCAFERVNSVSISITNNITVQDVSIPLLQFLSGFL